MRRNFKFISAVCMVICLAAIKSYAVDDIGDSAATPEDDLHTRFSAWLDQLRVEARERGINESTLKTALAQVQHLPRVIRSDRAQAEFTESYDEYIAKRVSDTRVRMGREYLREHGAAMRPIAEHYGVQPRFIAAIIGIETNYGTYKLSYSLFDVLATLAFDDRRSQRFRDELFAALKIIDNAWASVGQLQSSWAGALGVPQFMPSSYLHYAVDFDRDGDKDIWSHGPDMWASVANYLATFGWHDDETWARKVLLPKHKIAALAADKTNQQPIDAACERYSKHLYGWRDLSAWHAVGLRRLNGEALPEVAISASLIVTDPDHAQGYLVYRNFCTLMRYNPAFKYALGVGSLSDALK